MAALLAALLAVHPETKWDARINPACCSYPEHDPRDYNWPYSHLQYSEVIPDVMGSFVSMTHLNVTYPAGEVVEYGKLLSPATIEHQPAVTYALEPDRSNSTLHTLMMVDPDVPYRDRPTLGEWLHWLVYDIPGNDVSSGRTLVEYSAPAPASCPERDRFCLSEHRVTFILWEQPQGPLHLHAEDVARSSGTTEARAHYKARDFASRHRLGMQIAMNFFETEHGTLGEPPWWHVPDDASLAAVSHLIPHVERKASRLTSKEEL
ncbi:hypothetical protein AB1Y20_009656 [Prymnesium parvum]|uniref:Phosphatidylethanolamine-binding protein n=1 Tax=Prymnesium parvum TaxID=97485 RepID=A0AB34K275_PRYPA